MRNTILSVTGGDFTVYVHRPAVNFQEYPLRVSELDVSHNGDIKLVTTDEVFIHRWMKEQADDAICLGVDATKTWLKVDAFGKQLDIQGVYLQEYRTDDVTIHNVNSLRNVTVYLKANSVTW